MAVERSRSPDHPTMKSLLNVHLFNCDQTYKLESVEKLLRDVEANAKCGFSISKHYFPLPKMAETCAELVEYQMDFAIFVVHANESRLSLNEERAGIGYAKIYRALLAATGDRVLIVIGGDEYYDGEEDTQVLSRWAKLKILSQFSPEYLDGRKSFVLSWERKHRLIHEDAVRHFLDPDKQNQIFVPDVQSAPEPEHLKAEIDEPADSTSNETNADITVPLLPSVWNTEQAASPSSIDIRDDPPSEREKVKHPDCRTQREGGGLLRMRVGLEHGEIVDTIKKFPDNWEPPSELLSGLKKLFHDKPFVRTVEIWEEVDGSHSITDTTTKIAIGWLFAERACEMIKNTCFT